MVDRIHAQVIFQGLSNLPQDRYINTFAFHKPAGGVTGADSSHIAELLTEFYATPVPGHADPIASYLSKAIIPEPDPVINIYDADATGSPIAVESILGFAPAGHVPSLPHEVALCLSFHGDVSALGEEGPVDPVTGKKTRPRARRRGRVFIGPLSSSALAAVNDVPGRPLPELVTMISLAANRMMIDSSGLAPGMKWAVHSRKTGEMHDVVGGFVDNEFDTQRRRGGVSTSRVLFP